MIANKLHCIYTPHMPMFDEDLACFIYCNLYNKVPNSVMTKNIRSKMYMSYSDEVVTFVFITKEKPSICTLPRARFDYMKEKFNKSKYICTLDICGLKMDENDMFAILPDQAFKWEIKE